MRRHLALPTLLLIAGCGTQPQDMALIPDNTGLKLSSTVSISLEKMVYWGAYIGVAYLILDPLAPNWTIEEAQLEPQLVYVNMKMKRYYSGGAGEARLILDRRARLLVRAGDFASYQILEYNESLNSSVLGSQRITESVIRLIPKA